MILKLYIQKIDYLLKKKSQDTTLFIQRSSRTLRPPSYPEDFHCNLLLPPHINKTPHVTHKVKESSTKHSLSNYLSYNSLLNCHKEFATNIWAHYELQYYHAAANIPEWQEAMNKELHALDKNYTRSVVPLSQRKHSITL